MENQYSQYFSEKSLWEKIKKFSKTAGKKVVYTVLLLYYVMTDKGVSLKAKAIIIGALGYFIFPLDAIPDLAPLIGFSDDLGVLLFALSQVSDSVTPEIQLKAHNQLSNWFGSIDDDELNEINSHLH